MRTRRGGGKQGGEGRGEKKGRRAREKGKYQMKENKRDLKKKKLREAIETSRGNHARVQIGTHTCL